MSVTMNTLAILLIITVLQLFAVHCSRIKRPKKFNVTEASAKFSNPNYVNDRFKTHINKPEMPNSWKDRFVKPFHTAWMDYCDPYHCNDYHKLACGLNRDNMKFKWFQSVCHIILNNQCSTYRGHLKYDVIEAKYCRIYVMLLRTGCPSICDAEELDPRCGQHMTDGHVVLFRSQCAMDAVNCKRGRGMLSVYEEVHMRVCDAAMAQRIREHSFTETEDNV